MNFADCTCTPTPKKQGVIYSHTDSQILTTGKIGKISKLAALKKNRASKVDGDDKFSFKLKGSALRITQSCNKGYKNTQH